MKIIETIYHNGIEVEFWEHKSCTAQVGKSIKGKWATVYYVESEHPGNGHATELLAILKSHYEGQGLEFGSSIALNDRMRYLLEKLQIREYNQPGDVRY